MGVGRISRLLRGVGVIAMPNTGLDTTRRVDVPPGAGVLQLLAIGMKVRVFMDCRCVADGMDLMRVVIPAIRELFSDD
jgi:hypothetical protein